MGNSIKDTEEMAITVRDELKKLHEIEINHIKSLEGKISLDIYQTLRKRAIANSLEIYSLAHELFKCELGEKSSDEIFMPSYKAK